MLRRGFLKALMGITLLLVPATLQTGCTPSGAQALQMAQAFVASAQAVLAADPNAPYAADLTLAIQSMQTAIKGWNGSSTNCALTSSANIVATIINSVAPASPAALIATIAVAGFDALMAEIAPCTTSAMEMKALKAYPNNIRNTVQYQTQRDKFKKAWMPHHAYVGAFNSAAKQSGLNLKID